MGDVRGVQEGGDVGTLMLIRDVARKKPTKHCKVIIVQLKNTF